MAMATGVDLGDFVLEEDNRRTRVTELELSTKGGGARLAAAQAKHTLRERSLALTSPSPAPGEWRACTPVAQGRPLAPTAGTLRRRPRAFTQSKARSKQGVAATARMKPPIGIYLIIFFIKGGTQPPTKGNGDTGVQIEQEVGPSIPSPHQRLLWPRASTSRRASTREPSALTSGEPFRLLRA